MKDNHDLPKWDERQISGQKKINRRLTIRTGCLLIIVLLVIILAIVVTFASCNKDSTPQKPNNSASVSEIENYEQHKFSDNNAASIDKMSVSNNTKVLLVKVANIDVSSESSAANSFSQLTDELQSVGNYDVAKHGVIFYNPEKTFAIYFNQSHIQSLNSNYSDYIESGNYDSLFNNANAYYMSDDFKSANKKLNKLANQRTVRIISESLDLSK